MKEHFIYGVDMELIEKGFGWIHGAESPNAEMHGCDVESVEYFENAQIIKLAKKENK